MARTPVMAAGGIVLRREKNPRFAVVRLRKRNEWVLPKGKLDDGETPRAAAEREVLEETGHDVSVHEFLGTLVYESGGGFKVVHYWRMQAAGAPTHELMHDIREVDWLPLDAAVERLSRGSERAFLANVGPIALKAAADAEPVRRSRAKPAAAKPAASPAKPAAAPAKRRAPRVTPPAAPAVAPPPAPVVPAPSAPTAAPLAGEGRPMPAPDVVEVAKEVAPEVAEQAVERVPYVADTVPRHDTSIESDADVTEAFDAEAGDAEVPAAEVELPEAEIAEAETSEAETSEAGAPIFEAAEDEAPEDSDDFRMVPQPSEPEPAADESTQVETSARDSIDRVTEHAEQGTRSLVRMVRNWLRRAA